MPASAPPAPASTSVTAPAATIVSRRIDRAFMAGSSLASAAPAAPLGDEVRRSDRSVTSRTTCNARPSHGTVAAVHRSGARRSNQGVIMTWIRRALALSTLAGAALVAVPLSASAQEEAPPDSAAVSAADDAARQTALTVGAVYVLSNQPTGNSVIRFDRSRDGSLVAAGEYPTGGTGTGGSLSSQGAVTIDDAGRYLYAVNAGSGSVTSFRIRRDGLQLIDTAPSGGTMPTSVTVHGDLVYVLNAGGAGNISGFSVHQGDLQPLAGSMRPLSAAGTQPAEVAFSPDGDRVVVSERATQQLDVYAVN